MINWIKKQIKEIKEVVKVCEKIEKEIQEENINV
jgi:hypothetical protein